MDGNHRQFLIDLGARLAVVRRDRGLSQEQVAETVGVDPQTIQRAERGRTSLSLARLNDIATALDLPLSELFKSEDEAIPEGQLPVRSAEVLAVWASVPEERRDRALRVLREFTR